MQRVRLFLQESTCSHKGTRWSHDHTGTRSDSSDSWRQPPPCSASGRVYKQTNKTSLLDSTFHLHIWYQRWLALLARSMLRDPQILSCISRVCVWENNSPAITQDKGEMEANIHTIKSNVINWMVSFSTGSIYTSVINFSPFMHLPSRLTAAIRVICCLQIIKY